MQEVSGVRFKSGSGGERLHGGGWLEPRVTDSTHSRITQNRLLRLFWDISELDLGQLVRRYNSPVQLRRW